MKIFALRCMCPPGGAFVAYTRVYAILPVLVDFRKGLESPRRLHIGPREVLSFKQQRLCFGFRQRIGEAISKIQFGGVAAGLPKSRQA
jgi:hypothetical protein